MQGCQDVRAVRDVLRSYSAYRTATESCQILPRLHMLPRRDVLHHNAGLSLRTSQESAHDLFPFPLCQDRLTMQLSDYPAMTG